MTMANSTEAADLLDHLMTLLPCPGCGHQCEKTASFCPNCGMAIGYVRADQFGPASFVPTNRMRNGRSHDGIPNWTASEETSVASVASVATKTAPTLGDDAYHGPLGAAARAVAPYTESDPAGILVQLLAGFGSIVGPGPHVRVDRNRHPARLFPVLLGESSNARKGSAWSWARDILAELDQGWADSCLRAGLSSGEGLIADFGEGDDNTRRLVVEQEFARILKMCERDGNILSTVIRELWDSGDVSTLTRKDPLKVQGAHLTVVSHITVDELRRRLSETEQANGFANRHLFAYVRRTQCLPFGGGAPDTLVADIARTLRGPLDKARRIGTMGFSETAKPVWEERYREVWVGRDGLVGAVTARGVAQMLRLAVTYALADGTNRIGGDHVNAAYAMWRFCEESAEFVFGDSTGDPVVDRLLDALRAAGGNGLDGTQQRDLFGRHQKGTAIEAARKILEERGLIRTVFEDTGGRPKLISFATEATEATKV